MPTSPATPPYPREPMPQPPVSLVLAAYPHVARCAECRGYAAARLLRHPGHAVVTATLAHHDSGHRYDAFTVATQHFAAPA